MLFAREFESVHAFAHRRSGLRAIIVVHSTRRGPAFGGVRRLAYGDDEAAFDDAWRLARAMSLKCAMADLAAGGAKTVVLDHPGLRISEAYRELGRAIESMGGRYYCGPDVGTTDTELEALRHSTQFVNPPQNDAAGSTAAGVLAGVRGLLEGRGAGERVENLRCVIEGLGAVGFRVGRDLVARGGSVCGYDPDPKAVARARDAGIEIVDAADVLSTECDLFMPCALGHSISAERAERAPWRMVCGSANNQIVSARAESILEARGITWAPDFVVNAGAVIEGVSTTVGRQAGGGDPARAIADIAGRCAAVVNEARSKGRTPGAVARAWAHERLAALDDEAGQALV